jgi:hypothetical protein
MIAPMLDGLERFRPLALPLGDEEELLERALERLHELEPGEIAILPEYVAWTEDRSEIAYGTLLGVAVEHRLGIVTTLNLPPDLMEDLPGRDGAARFNALTIFTPHGDVHVPQAKLIPQAFEMSAALQGPNIGVRPYPRLNRVRLDLGGEDLLEARFLLGSDLWAMGRMPADALRADLWIVPANLARGGEAYAARLLEAARAAKLAGATVLCNAEQPGDEGQPPHALPVEEVREAPGRDGKARWPDRKLLDDAFRLYPDARAGSFAELASLPERAGRIALPESLAPTEPQLGDYPITIVL